MAKDEKDIHTTGKLIHQTETERLLKDIYRPDMEKLQLFTKMLRNNLLLKKAVIRHK